MRLIQTRRGLIPQLAQVFRKAEEDGTDPPDEWKAAALVTADSPLFINIRLEIQEKYLQSVIKVIS